MSIETERNKEVVRGFLEKGFIEAARGNPKALEAYCAPHYVMHAARSHDHTAAKGMEGLVGYAREAGRASRDLTIAVDVILAEGDLVAAHWHTQGTHHGRHQLAHHGEVEPTGKALNVSGSGIYRLKDGKIVEGWAYDNVLSTLMQMGVTKPATA